MSPANHESQSTGLVAVFPGQGSQQIGMGKDLYENFAVVRETFEEASDAIHTDLKKLCFEGPESDLTLTENTQPCLLTTSVAAFRVARQEFGFKPDAVAGHSLGEYSALVAIDCLRLSSAVSWVKERGRAMQRAVPAGEGTMAAILGLEDPAVEELCAKATENAARGRPSDPGQTSAPSVSALVQPANFNAPGQVVIAGSVDAVQEAIRLIKSESQWSGGKAIPLAVSAPFHCRLMRPAREKMAEIFSQLAPKERPAPLKIPYVANRTGRLNQEATLVLDFLVEQVDHPVLWKQSIQYLFSAHLKAAVEFGPGKVLSGLIKRIASTEGKSCALTSVGDSASVSALQGFLKTQNASLTEGVQR